MSTVQNRREISWLTASSAAAGALGADSVRRQYAATWAAHLATFDILCEVAVGGSKSGKC
jgi:hypothetical protein